MLEFTGVCTNPLPLMFVLPVAPPAINTLWEAPVADIVTPSIAGKAT